MKMLILNLHWIKWKMLVQTGLCVFCVDKDAQVVPIGKYPRCFKNTSLLLTPNLWDLKFIQLMTLKLYLKMFNIVGFNLEIDFFNVK